LTAFLFYVIDEASTAPLEVKSQQETYRA
jgi:hypothetical protein